MRNNIQRWVRTLRAPSCAANLVPVLVGDGFWSANIYVCYKDADLATSQMLYQPRRK